MLSTSTGALLVARIAFWSAMALWGAVELRNARVLSTADRTQDRGTFRWTLLSTLGGLAAVLVLDGLVPAVVAEEDQAPFIGAGAALVVGGVAFRLWAIRTLGQYFTYQVTTTANQRVVTAGPYRWLCHPSYTGLLISCLGAGVASANLAALLAVIVIPTYGMWRRIRVEEDALLRAIGDDYRRFVATRRRLVPGIW